MKPLIPPLLAVLFTVFTVSAQQKTVTIATVNNPPMLELKKLSPKFEEKNPDIKLSWVIVEENVLRQRVTTDVSTGSGQFDIVFIGLYETPIFAKRGWLRPFGELPPDYDIEDVFKSLRELGDDASISLVQETRPNEGDVGATLVEGPDAVGEIAPVGVRLAGERDEQVGVGLRAGALARHRATL